MNRLPVFLQQVMRRPVLVTAVMASLWAMASADWLWFRPGDTGTVTSILRNLVFLAATALAVAWSRGAIRHRDGNPVLRSAVLTAVYVIGWQMAVYVSGLLGWHVLTTQLARVGTALLFLVGLMWVVYGVEVASQFHERIRRLSTDVDDGATELD
ncbi:MAG: hypothetical protein VX877_06465, partial [Planctomycetota bacterium]|nr:hypothetical protein [Planctomycetota bacterium]